MGRSKLIKYFSSFTPLSPPWRGRFRYAGWAACASRPVDEGWTWKSRSTASG